MFATQASEKRLVPSIRKAFLGPSRADWAATLENWATLGQVILMTRTCLHYQCHSVCFVFFGDSPKPKQLKPSYDVFTPWGTYTVMKTNTPSYME